MAVNQIKAGAIISYVALLVNVLIGLLYTPWLISSIGKSDYGLYTLAMSIIGLLSFDFGLGNATTKFITQYLANGLQDRINNLLGLIYKLYLVVDIFVFVGLTLIYIFLPEIYSGLTSGEIGRFSKIFIIVAGFCILSFPFIPLNGVLTSYEMFIQLKLCDLINKLLIIASMSICLLLGYGLYALVLINSGAGILTILIKLWIIKQNTNISVNFAFWSNDEFKIIFSFVIWVTIAALSQRMIFNISPSILGIFATTHDIALLGVAITVESYVYLFANALNGMFLPRVSRLLAANKPNAILDLMIKVGRLQIYVIGFICIWLFVFGSNFIDNWIGHSYYLAYPCIVLIIFPSFFQLPQEIGLTYIIASNNVKLQSYVYLIMGLVNIILSIPLSMKFGVVGLCVSIFIAYMTRTVGLNFIFKNTLKINVLEFYAKSYGKLIPILLFTLVFALIVNYSIQIDGWSGLLVKSVILVIEYVAVLYYLGFNTYEKNLLIAPIINKLFKIK